jgi:chromosome segregation ATPase
VKESGKILHEQAKPISIENTQESEERDSKTNLLIELENENENLKNSLEKALSKIEELESQLKSKTNEKETFTNELKKKIEVLTDENFRLMKVVKDDERKAESKELKRVKIEIGPGNIERLNEKVLLQADTLFEKEVEIKMIRKQRDELFQSIKDLEETNKEAKILREHIFFLMNTFQQFKIKLLSLAKEFEVNSEDHQGMPIIEKFITSIKTLAKSMKTESRAFFQKRPDCLNGFFRDALTEKFKYSMKHFSDFKIEQEKFD